ncbi:ankyrin repeat domain-containing protein [Paenibacillus caseinilyticus]|uniref:Ankyrin n=1 Tax=Paenibacillus mucilaginosus K02 TaxID=997761 RepID=I0BKP1_9BACL|nr:ankyrin repeat domain-containing protein [Paenibacillus mucilaginosus]AFH62938.1 ankyrin [Paenibacillus mucilaginosus K02]
MDFDEILEKNDAAMLREYLTAHDVDEEENGQTLLYRATFHGKVNIVEELIQYGAEINRQDPLGRTPISCASYFGHTRIAELLLHNGADPYICDYVGKTALERAKKGWEGQTHQAILELLKSA